MTTTTATSWAPARDPFLAGGPVGPDDSEALAELVDAGLFYCGRPFRHARHEVTKDGQDVWCAGRRPGAVKPAPKHRASVRVSHRSYPLTFTPRHCAGVDCLHAHPGEADLPTIRPAAPVAADAPMCRPCRGTGSRLHGWAICPGTCADCDGTGRQLVAASSEEVPA